MLLGCDGIHSAVRSLYVDPAVVPEYTGISTMYGFVLTSDLPPSSITNVYGATFTPHGLFGVIPCTAAGDVLYWLLSYEVPIPSALRPLLQILPLQPQAATAGKNTPVTPKTVSRAFCSRYSAAPLARRPGES
jgi:hypothetical protein